MRDLADVLGFPECMTAASISQIEAGVLHAGARLSSFWKLSKVRGHPQAHQARKRLRSLNKLAQRDPNWIPF